MQPHPDFSELVFDLELAVLQVMWSSEYHILLSMELNIRSH